MKPLVVPQYLSKPMVVPDKFKLHRPPDWIEEAWMDAQMRKPVIVRATIRHDYPEGAA